MRPFLFLFVLALVACTAADVPTAGTSSNGTEVAAWQYENNAAALRGFSCPDSVAYERAASIEVQVIEAERGSSNARRLNLDAVTLSGAWHLKSDESGFGGLSGLAALPSGSLLAVTDDGKFVWIGVDRVTGEPDGTAALAPMRDRAGLVFDAKRDADAEDLTFRDGLAFVSFEQDHRIAAYDLESCGAAARAASVVDLGDVVSGHRLKNNRGPEALAFANSGLSVGFEMQVKGGSPIGQVRVDGTLAAMRQTEQPNLYLLTGMDHQDGLQALVFRIYDPVRGPRAILSVHDETGEIAKATLRKPLPVDNFEGVAIGVGPDGGPRIWVISDDNFSRDQRTLLLALDLDQ